MLNIQNNEKKIIRQILQFLNNMSNANIQLKLFNLWENKRKCKNFTYLCT